MWSFVSSLSDSQHVVMSIILAFGGTESTISADFFPPIELNENDEYQIGLLSFESYNSIPNVDVTNNKFHFDNGKSFEIPVGAYEVNDIAQYIRHRIGKLSTPQKPYHIDISTNNNTLQTSIKATFDVDFSQPDSIGRLLGFKENNIIKANEKITTAGVVDISNINVVRIECNVATGSYVDGKSEHTVYQFFPNVPAGYRILEVPSPVIYLPITTHVIENITLRIVDQNAKLVNFRGERISIRLHIKRLL